MADREEAAEVEAEAEAARRRRRRRRRISRRRWCASRRRSPPTPRPTRRGRRALRSPRRLRELLGGTLRFHAREAKPGWWRRFERLATPAEELADDQNVLAFLRRTEREPYKESPRKRRQVFEYEFDAAQECTLAPGATVLVRADGDGDAPLGAAAPSVTRGAACSSKRPRSRQRTSTSA